MAKIKDIIEMAPDSFKTSLVDVLIAIDSSKTKKYVPMMLKVLQNKSDENNRNTLQEDFIGELRDYYGISNFPDTIDPKIAYMLLQILGSDIIKDLMNFMDSSEKGYFKGLDITTISSRKELIQWNGLTALNKIGKELAKQVQKDFEDEEWLVVRPFTYESSVKYGYGSKWCTSMEQSAEHFFRYSNNGTLIYCLNKKTGDKRIVNISDIINPQTLKKLTNDIKEGEKTPEDENKLKIKDKILFENSNVLAVVTKDITTKYYIISKKDVLLVLN
jgi:hypothetical protein